MSEPWRNDTRVVGAAVRVSHVREEGRPVRTVASIDDGEQIHFGVAMCHPNDIHFSRKRGRAIACGRARFALAKSLKLTEREGRPSRYQVCDTVPREEFVEIARSYGVPIPTNKDEGQPAGEAAA